MVDLNKIESQYKIHIDSEKVQPPPDLWNRVEESLNKKTANNKILWLKITGIAASVLAILFMGNLFLSDKSDEQILLSNNKPFDINVSGNDNGSLNNNPNGAQQYTETSKTEDYILSQSRILNKQEGQYIAINKLIVRNQDNLRDFEFNRHSKIYSVNNYIVTDKVEIKSLKSENPGINWQDLYIINTTQNNQSKEITRFGNKIEIGGVYSPVYAFRQTSGPEGLTGNMFTGSGPNEKPLIYTGGGIRLNVMVDKKWSVESGVRFARLGQEVNSQVDAGVVLALNALSTESDVRLKRVSLINSLGSINQTSSGNSTKNNLFYGTPSSEYHFGISNNNTQTSSTLEQNLDYLEIPLTLRYYLVNKGMSLSLSVGLSTNWLVSNNVYLKEESGKIKIGETSGISSLTMSTNAGLAFSVPVAGRLSLQLEPRINYFLSDINKDFPVSFKPYSFGIYSGLQYTFGK